MRTGAQREKPSPQIGSSCRASEFTARGVEGEGDPLAAPPQPPVEENNRSNRADFQATGLGGLLLPGGRGKWKEKWKESDL